MPFFKKILSILGILIFIGTGCVNKNDPRYVDFIVSNNKNASEYINLNIIPAYLDSVKQYREKYGNPVNFYSDKSGNSIYEFKENYGLIEISNVADEDADGIAIVYLPNELTIDKIFKDKLLKRAEELSVQDVTTILWIINNENWSDSTIHYGFEIKGRRIVRIF